MFKFFDFLVNLISSIIDFVVSLVSMIIFVLEYIGKGLAYVVLMQGMLPPFVVVPIVVIVSYTIVITIIHMGD